MDGQKIKVSRQESKKFWGSYKTIRPDIVLKKNNMTYVIDTKWKQPKNNSASINDLRQMYAYSRFWKSTKAMLLYPGKPINKEFIAYRNNEHDNMDHHCKLAKVSVFNSEGEINNRIGLDILEEIEI